MKDAETLAKTVGPVAKHYVKVMEKVVNGSEAYLEKESKRYVSSNNVAYGAYGETGLIVM